MQSGPGELMVQEEDNFLRKISAKWQTISTGNFVFKQELDSGQWIDPQAF